MNHEARQEYRRIATETLGPRQGLRQRTRHMALARLSDVKGMDDIGHQLHGTYASLQPWARSRLYEIGTEVLSNPVAYQAQVWEGTRGARLTTFWVTPPAGVEEPEVFVAIFLASATATGRGRASRRGRVTRGAEAIPGSLRVTPTFGDDGPVVPQYIDVAEAATAEDETSNWFTDMLEALLSLHQPEHLHVSSSKRMIRALSFLGDIYACLTRYVHLVITGSGERLNPRSAEGSMRLTIEGLFSAIDRDNTVQGQVGGKLSRTLEGQFVLTHKALPPGWRKVGRTGPPLVDESVAPLVLLLIHTFGTGSLSELDAVLQEARVVSPHGSEFRRWAYDPDAVTRMLQERGLPVPDVSRPAVVTQPDDRLLVYSRTMSAGRVSKWLDAWSGRPFEFEIAIPRGAKVLIDGIPHWQAQDGSVEALLSCTLRQPPFPWAPQRLLEDAEVGIAVWARNAKAQGKRVSRGYKTGYLPLTGPVGAWSDGEHAHKLRSDRTLLKGDLIAVYEMRRQPQPADGIVRWQRDAKAVGETLGLVWAHELHRALADAVIEAAQDNLSLREDVNRDFGTLQPGSHPRVTGVDEIRVAQAEVADAERAGAAAAALIASAPNGDPASSTYLEIVHKALADAAARLDRARSRLSTLQARAADDTVHGASAATPPDGRMVGTELELVRAIFDELGSSIKMTKQFNDGLASILRLRLTRTDAHWVTFTAEVGGLQDGRTAWVLTGITGRVPNRGTSVIDEDGNPVSATSLREAHRANIEARVEYNLERVMGHGEDLIDLLQGPRFELTAVSRWGQQTRRAMVTRLVALAEENGYHLTKNLAAIILRISIPETRLALWHALTHRGLPAGADPVFAAHIARCYLGPGAVPTWSSAPHHAPRRNTASHWAYSHAVHHLLTDFLRDQPNKEAHRDMLQALVEEHGGNRQTLKALEGKTSRSTPAVLKRNLCSRPGCKPQCKTHFHLGLQKCPHPDCDGYVDTLTRILEVPTETLCSSCRRMPTPHSPVFPLQYLTAARTYADDLVRVAPDVAGARVASGLKNARVDWHGRADALAAVTAKGVHDLTRRGQQPVDDSAA